MKSFSRTRKRLKHEPNLLLSNNQKREFLEIQYPKTENSRLGLIQSIHDRYWMM